MYIKFLSILENLNDSNCFSYLQDKSNRPFLSTSTISENQENKVPDR